MLSLGGGAVLSPRDPRPAARATASCCSTSTSRTATAPRRAQPRPARCSRSTRARVLKVLLEQRMPLYREVATDVVDTERPVGPQVVDEVLALRR